MLEPGWKAEESTGVYRLVVNTVPDFKIIA
jgi:hypothetical protein